MFRLGLGLLLLSSCVAAAVLAGAQTPVAVGRISGSDFRLKGQVEFAPDGSTVLLSGVEVEVRGGVAKLEVPGGQARFCGPMKVVVLKSATPASATEAVATEAPLLFAVESGTLELEYVGAASHTIQTPYFSVATMPLPDAAPRSASLRLGEKGETCIASLTGTLRIREQFGAAEMMLPVGKAVMIPSVEVDKATAVVSPTCACAPPAAAPSALKVEGGKDPGAPASPPPAPAPSENSPAPATSTTIAAAPLVYEASAQPETQPTPPKEAVVTLPVVVSGAARPAETGANAGSTTASAASTAAPQTAPPPAKPKEGFGTKLKRFFRKLFGR